LIGQPRLGVRHEKWKEENKKCDFFHQYTIVPFNLTFSLTARKAPNGIV
jgi:hypothetical protein